MLTSASSGTRPRRRYSIASGFEFPAAHRYRRSRRVLVSVSTPIAVGGCTQHDGSCDRATGSRHRRGPLKQDTLQKGPLKYPTKS
jgi:hypothetical protein